VPFADLEDVSLFYTDDGIDGEPVVLLHGWGCDSHDWNWQIHALLSEGYRVLAPDLRGHGRSSVPQSHFAPQDCAHDVAQLLNQRGISSVVAIGHSFGAFVASALAVEYPSLVRAMITVDPGYGRDDSLAETASKLITALSESHDSTPAVAVFEHMDGPETPMSLCLWHRRRVLGMPREVLLKALHGLYLDPREFASRAGADAYLARRSCPVLAIHTIPSQADWETTLFRHPASRASLCSGTGHWLHQERDADFNRLVLDWLHQLPTPDEVPADPLLHGQ
jgi:pimeloyl-ACP methyl ester carboxylesterase